MLCDEVLICCKCFERRGINWDPLSEYKIEKFYFSFDITANEVEYLFKWCSIGNYMKQSIISRYVYTLNTDKWLTKCCQGRVGMSLGTGRGFHWYLAKFWHFSQSITYCLIYLWITSHNTLSITAIVVLSYICYMNFPKNWWLIMVEHVMVMTICILKW